MKVISVIGARLNFMIDASKIFFVGNVMIDSLINYLPKIHKLKIHSELNVQKENYCLITLNKVPKIV
jgi:UDP-N-acetylglucosamine 2-epimerase (non-hydrolysing)